MLRSLTSRIFIASLILLPLLLSFSAYMLDRAFTKSLHSAEEQALLAQIYALLGATEPEENKLKPPLQMSDPRFSTPESGLYGVIIDNENKIIWQSDSLINATWRSDHDLKNAIPKNSPGQYYFTQEKIADETYFLYSLGTIWEFEEGEKAFQFIVIHSQAQIKQELKTYRKTLWLWLTGLALMLIIIQTAVIRWGLLPLQILASQIKQIEQGTKAQLDGQYPREISAVTNNINLLLTSEKKQRERYKNTLGDLAHSLKTPLAIIRSQMGKTNLDDNNVEKPEAIIDQQIDRMSNIVQHQLNRASSQIKKTYLSKIDLYSLIEKLSNALQKIYREKEIHFVNQLEQPTMLYATEDDVMELFGNLVENAFKYSNKRVNISSTFQGNDIFIIIDDDGPGVPDEMKQTVLTRGARADTKQPGQGIGLAVATDIISSYDGALNIETSDFGGARFVVILPN